jgi:hypothetical protein
LIKAMPILAAVAAIWAASAYGADPAQEVLALERRAMDGWLQGNPDPQLAISDPQITYFHAVVEKRIEGLPALKELFDRYRGIPLFDSYEILNPQVQVAGDVAVLTYQLAQRNGAVTTYWNGTQVYRKKEEGWRVIHTHWSAAKAQQP